MASAISSVIAPVGNILGSTVGGLVGGVHSGMGLGQSTNIERPDLIIPTTVSAEEARKQAAATQASIEQQARFAQALGAQNGLQKQTDVYNQLLGAANQDAIAVTPSNVAQSQLNQATGANIAAQAALMANQRGSQANPALLARQAALQGANIQQQAAGQAATLLAQEQQAAQQLNAQLAMQQRQQQLAALDQAAGIGSQQAALQEQALRGVTAGRQTSESGTQQAISDINRIRSGVAQSATDIHAKDLARSEGQKSAMLSGLIKGGSAAIAKKAAEGGIIEDGTVKQSKPSFVSSYFQKMANGGEVVPTLLSPGEKFLTPEAVSRVKNGSSPMAVGKTVPGTPIVSGAKDDYRNDIVPMGLKEGSIVLPRSVTKAKNSETKAQDFVAALLSKRRNG